MNILILILKIIEIILDGYSPVEAVDKVSKESGVACRKLWSNLPEKYK